MKRMMIVAALFAACQTEESAYDDLPVDMSGPPLVLSSTPLVKGSQATLTVSGAPANKLIYFLRSSGVQTDASCPPPLAPECLDLRNPATVTFQRNANGAGVAAMTFTVPANLAVASLSWQAGHVAPGALSNTITTPVYDPNSDTDNDGIAAVEELQIGTDPGDADTDGGGVNDGDEVAQGSDPLDPADDAGPAPKSYAADVLPLFRQTCAGCHTGGAALGNLNLEQYNQVMAQSTQANMRRVTANSTQQSYLFRKLEGTHIAAGGSGTRMPQGAPAFTASQMQIVSDWINSGALP